MNDSATAFKNRRNKSPDETFSHEEAFSEWAKEPDNNFYSIDVNKHFREEDERQIEVAK